MFFFLGQSNVTAQCDSGYYCSNSSIAARPGSLAQGGGKCPIGFYCPKGSPKPLICKPGQYCPHEALSEPIGNCSEGYYCLAGASSSKPTDKVTGDICPAGAYCPNGSQNYTLCPPGTYSNETGNRNVSNCLSCTEGYYCMGWGNKAPTAKCNAGFYCPVGQIRGDPPPYDCWKAYYCEAGSATPKPCPSGSYQNEVQQATCKVRILLFLIFELVSL